MKFAQHLLFENMQIKYFLQITLCFHHSSSFIIGKICSNFSRINKLKLNQVEINVFRKNKIIRKNIANYVSLKKKYNKHHQ